MDVYIYICVCGPLSDRLEMLASGTHLGWGQVGAGGGEGREGGASDYSSTPLRSLELFSGSRSRIQPSGRWRD